MADIFGGLAKIRPSVWGVIALVIILCVVGFVAMKKNKTASSITTKMHVYGGMCVALSFVLSYIKVWRMPQGGSITLISMFPIILYALVFGPIAGIVAGIAYGFLQLFQDMYILHWAQVIFDYPLAFGALGLAGFIPTTLKSLRVRFALGITLGIFGRYCMAVISGAVFFAEYAGDMNPWIYSMGYNATYLSVEWILTLIVGIVLASTPIYKTMKASIYS